MHSRPRVRWSAPVEPAAGAIAARECAWNVASRACPYNWRTRRARKPCGAECGRLGDSPHSSAFSTPYVLVDKSTLALLRCPVPQLENRSTGLSLNSLVISTAFSAVYARPRTRPSNAVGVDQKHPLLRQGTLSLWNITGQGSSRYCAMCRRYLTKRSKHHAPVQRAPRASRRQIGPMIDCASAAEADSKPEQKL